jgi:hypothetical protein
MLSVSLREVSYTDPSTPASRTFFVLYAVIALPTVGAFFIQAFSQTIEAINDKRIEKEMARKGVKPKVGKDTTIGTHHTYVDKSKPDPERNELNEEEDEFRPFISHAELVERYHSSFSKPGKVLSARKLHDTIEEEDREDQQEEHVCNVEEGDQASVAGEDEASGSDAISESRTAADKPETDPIEKNTDEILAKGARAALKGDDGNPDLTSDDHPDLAKAMLDELLLHARAS